MQMRLGLRTVLFLVAGLAVLLGVYVQWGRAEATFEVWENDLQLDAEGRISGILTCGYRGPGTGEDQAWPLVFEIHRVPRCAALELQPGRQRRIAFRYQPWWPLQAEDPFAFFVRRELGIPADRIVGHVVTDEETQIVIQGR